MKNSVPNRVSRKLLLKQSRAVSSRSIGDLLGLEEEASSGRPVHIQSLNVHNAECLRVVRVDWGPVLGVPVVVVGACESHGRGDPRT